MSLLALPLCVLGQSTRDYVVMYTEKLPYDSLFQYHKTNKTHSSERALHILNSISLLSQRSGQAVESYLSTLPSTEAQYHKLSVYNGLLLHTKPEIASQIAEMDEVEYVEDITDIKIFLHAPTRIGEDEERNSRAIGAAEPGLVAVGARTMWQMGYTGKGTKVLSFDTGIWPNHPALGGRFMGEHFPLDRSWKGYFSPTPVDKGNSHGTHTVGTMAGLDMQTLDTIGLAFGAYFMATDPIVSNLSDTLGMPNLILAYEWALNPDGDPNTVDDIPDVICNSWGSSGNAGFCGSFVADMLQNIDLLGIANEYSAGNNGPGPGTVGIVALVSPSELNAFSVGAINGNTSSFPIASFSSRGPTPCLGGGALEIKPEVVAPGVNVRSCVKQNAYSSYDGTSMAGPHVAGAMLLLKEAFPYLPGDALKEALYFSALDLGDPGEDNTYGNGIIHVGQAFNWLVSQGNIPVPSQSDVPELALLKVPVSQSGLYCNSIFNESLTLLNEGILPIQDTIRFSVYHNTNLVIQWAQYITLNPGETIDVAMPAGVSLIQGQNEIWISVVQKSNPVEKDNVNNNRTYRPVYIPSVSVPYTQSFEGENFAAMQWTVVNPDIDRTFELYTTQGQDEGTRSAAMRFLLYNPVNAQKDWLISPPIELLSNEPHYVGFDIAYQIRAQNQKDTLSLWASTDCGITFDHLIFEGSPQEMVTFTATSPANFVPVTEEHWKRLVFPIPQSLQGETVQFAFRSVNYRGANAYLDDFAVFTETDPLFVQNYGTIPAQVYPNPFSNSITISFGMNVAEAWLILKDVSGRTVADKKVFESESNVWNLPEIAAGVYYLNITSGNAQQTFKLIKTEK
ncbi:MAG: S8 family peptidase [Flavobacteriales bacterium]|nr:S8 family peptidase [Flavobacteriales bacterium]